MLLNIFYQITNKTTCALNIFRWNETELNDLRKDTVLANICFRSRFDPDVVLIVTENTVSAQKFHIRVYITLIVSNLGKIL